MSVAQSIADILCRQRDRAWERFHIAKARVHQARAGFGHFLQVEAAESALNVAVAEVRHINGVIRKHREIMEDCNA